MAPLRYALPCILAAIAVVQASELRGVAPEQKPLYTPHSDGHWECLDSSKKIPYTAINDDYCDCPDGSDEPGTSACPNSLFYCNNEGHIAAYIKSYAVNDGVCDDACCDGSDETSGLISCPNRCKGFAAEYAREQAVLHKIHSAGIAAKRKLIQQGLETVSGWQEEKSKLEDALAIKRAELIRLQREVEAIEADVKSHSSKKKPSSKKIKCPPCNSLTLRDHIETLEDEIDTLVTILKDMKRDHNHNFHDMAVKAAIAGYNDFIEGYDELKADIDKDLAKYSNDEDSGFDIEQYDDNGEEGGDVEEDTPEETAEKAGKVSFIQTWLQKLAAVIPPDWRGLVPLEKAENNGSVKSGGSALEAAKKAHSDVNSEIQSTEKKLNAINDDLGKDYGKHYEWLRLKDVCTEKNEGEYTYSVCIFGDAYQKSNKDGARVKLGRFEKFLDDDHMKQIYPRGTKCWNGPERSVHAAFECGGETEILEVTEPEKCEYRYRMKTPAVCPIPEEAAKDKPVVTPVKGPTKPTTRVHEEL
ncbi:glucosidase II beta subunit-like-domain-containing protein [Zychaea mexicana]|uniref:glucosidase II beta subunit-like-domain-containing protein n=1 Tax=Zychaea mexicana TaxID=64656 RepID=UPI0022FE8706|nr:glucosidase II beta subunit-like-domain-containing protein [Zychaea mexicana]KAI9494851.1 glucosidase II beta subunit-like-domain-containing protein [Zychaea mexicana]